MKNNEIELINKKHREFFDEIKKDSEKNKKFASENLSLKEISQKQNITIKSTITILLEVLDILISQRSNPINHNLIKSLSVTQNTGQQGEINNNSYSMDIYDSYNNEEEKKTNIIEQIQNVIIAKIAYIKKTFNIDFDKEIQK